MSDKITELGIAPYEITPSVSIAVNGLLRRIDDLSQELENQKELLDNLQSMVHVDADLILPNYKAFLSRIAWSVALHKRYSYSASVVIMQIDNHEELARVQGSRAAQLIESRITSYMPQNIRDTDFFAKISGHEFGLIMYFADRDNITKKCEAMVADLKMHPIRWNNAALDFDLAFGVHQIASEDSPEGAYNAAKNLSYIKGEQKKFEEINFKA